MQSRRHASRGGLGSFLQRHILQCDDTLVPLRRLRGIVSVDHAACEATVRAGSKLDDLGSALHELDLTGTGWSG